MSKPETSPCRGCAKPVVWARSPSGGKIPLDPTPPVYTVTTLSDGSVKCERAPGVMVLHFATCSSADLFSKDKKTTGQAWEGIRDEKGAIVYLQAFEGDPPGPDTTFLVLEEVWTDGRPPKRLIKAWRAHHDAGIS